MEGEFSVCQFFEDDSYEYVRGSMEKELLSRCLLPKSLSVTLQRECLNSDLERR